MAFDDIRDDNHDDEIVDSFDPIWDQFDVLISDATQLPKLPPEIASSWLGELIEKLCRNQVIHLTGAGTACIPIDVWETNDHTQIDVRLTAARTCEGPTNGSVTSDVDITELANCLDEAPNGLCLRSPRQMRVVGSWHGRKISLRVYERKTSK